jgi:transketolase
MSTSSLLGRDVRHDLHELAQQLRVDSVRCSAAASSGHPTSSMSAADLMAVLLARHLRYDFDEPAAPGNDHLIFSKGHASPLYYSMLLAAGAITDEELLTYRAAGSRLEGHPTPALPWVDVATGSLGQGIAIGVGVALAGKELDKLPYRVWALCGDSELAEGSVWEAAEHAGYTRCDNLTVIVDVNRLGQRGPTRHECDLGAYAARFRAFGWHVIEIDGHDVAAVDAAYAAAASHTGEPAVILARTRKGRGVAAVEDKEGAHGKPLPDAAGAIRELGGQRGIRVTASPPPPVPPSPRARPAASAPPPGVWRPPAYDIGDTVETRAAFGQALAALGDIRPEVVVLDGEVGDSTRAGLFAQTHPDRFFECYIAEQQMVAMAVGMQVRGWLPYAATFAAFFTRAYDFIRMAAVSRASIRLAGSHAGVAIGQDGPSQMALEDLAMMRAVHGSTVLYPCDANQAAWLTGAMADIAGISYLRTSRGGTPVIYEPGERFEIGGSRVLRSAPDDQVTIVAAGVTVPEALAAADMLAGDGVSARVIDAYSVKPIDAVTLRESAAATGRVVTVEDHWPEGGLGDAVLSALAAGPALAGGPLAVPGPLPAVRKLAVTTMPGSAAPDEQLRLAGIDMASIAAAAADIVAGHPQG